MEQPHPSYDIDFFIAKFKAIPEHLWYVGDFHDPENYHKKCAIGHLRSNYEEFKAFFELLETGISVAQINDGGNPTYTQPTAKQRILAFCYDIKERLEVEKVNLDEITPLLNIKRSPNSIKTKLNKIFSKKFNSVSEK